MSNIWLLVKVQLGTALDFNFISKDKKRNKKNNKLFYLGITLFFLILFSFVSFMYSYAIGTTLILIGMLKLLPELMMAITCIITFFTTIYKVKGTLFGFKDYDVTMSLPVKTSTIVASRLILLYLINIIFTVIVILPADIAYGILANETPIFYIMNLFIVFFIPLVPMVAAAIIGTIIAVAAAGFKHSNVINIILSFLFLSIFMIYSFRIGDSEEKIGQMSAALTKQVDSLYPLAGMYRRAVCDYNILSLATFVLISLVTFIAFSELVGLKFKAINSLMTANRTKSNYKLAKLEQTSPFRALFRKELKRFFSSSLYVMNTAFGIVMMTIGGVATIFLSPETLTQILEIPETGKYIGVFAPIAISMCVALTNITAHSISLEGKNLWILKASPISTKIIFDSKIAVNLIVTLPAIFLNGIIITFGLGLGLTDLIILWVMPTAYAFFTGISGLIINLTLPNLNWTTEVTVIKQSAAALISLLIGMVIVAIPAVLLVKLPVSSLVVNGITTAVTAILSFLLYRFLNSRGARIFSTL